MNNFASSFVDVDDNDIESASIGSTTLTEALVVADDAEGDGMEGDEADEDVVVGAGTVSTLELKEDAVLLITLADDGIVSFDGGIVIAEDVVDTRDEERACMWICVYDGCDGDGSGWVWRRDGSTENHSQKQTGRQSCMLNQMLSHHLRHTYAPLLSLCYLAVVG